MEEAIKYFDSQQKMAQAHGYNHLNIQYWKKKGISPNFVYKNKVHGFMPKTGECLSFIDLSEEQEPDL